MPTPKRQRKKSGRLQAQAAAQKRQRRQRQRRQAWIMGALGVVLAVSMVLWAFASQKPVEQQVSSTATSTTRAPTTSTTEVDAPCPKADGSSVFRDQFRRQPRTCIDVTKKYVARVETDLGPFEIALDPQKAPETVNNFVFLSRYHFFDGLTFFQAKPNFVILTGDPAAEGSSDAGYQFKPELPKAGEYKIGSVAMANPPGSQWFVMVGADAVKQPPQNALFGQVTGGIEVAIKIANDGNPKPNEFTPKKIHVIRQITIQES